MKLRLLLTVLLVCVLCGSALAQDYSFEVPEMELHVTVNPDASVTMKYKITFLCNTDAKPIDIVDIGVPHEDYDIGNMTAHLDGEELATIRRSEYVHPGVEVPLDAPIGSGETGVFEFECTMPNLVHQDTTNKENASLRITPTWFDGDYMTGTTNLAVIVYLPDSIELDEILYQLNQPFDNKLDLDDKKAVAWVFDDTTVDHEHMVGLSFPKREMERVVSQTLLGLVWKWWRESSGVRAGVGVLFLVLFGIFYYRFSGGTGTCLFIPMVIALAIVWAASPALEAIFLPILVPIWYAAEKLAGLKRRDYLPAIESVPGGGIKRGLAVPEAAVILEQPLSRVVTMVFFGMLKKNLVRLVSHDPLEVELVEAYDTSRKLRRKIAKERGTIVRGYEQRFLDALAKRPGVPVAKLDLRDAMKHIVNNTAKRLKGFDLEQTREYYLSIVNKAWQEAKEIGEVEQRTEYVDDNLLWLMLADDYTDGFDTWHRSGYHYRPAWGGGTGGTGAPAPQAPAVGGRTTFGDVAASFAGWSENVSGNLAGSLDPVSLGLARGGGIDLSGVDTVSMDVLNSLAESSGSGGGGGGGGGGCACACAGCACACACAGGGR